jgi:hypothetical protein
LKDPQRQFTANMNAKKIALLINYQLKASGPQYLAPFIPLLFKKLFKS